MSDIIKKGKAVKLPKGRAEELKETVRTFTNLYKDLKTLDQDELHKALYLEHNGEARPRVLKLIHGRYNTVRRDAELHALGV